MKPAVANIRVACLRKTGYNSLEDWLAADPNHMYIGRGMTAYVKGANKSKWHNPYPVKTYGLDESLRLYEEHIRNSPLWDQLPELEGKVLGCWCAPDRCHGDVLARLFEEYQTQAGVETEEVREENDKLQDVLTEIVNRACQIIGPQEDFDEGWSVYDLTLNKEQVEELIPPPRRLFIRTRGRTVVFDLIETYLWIHRNPHQELRTPYGNCSLTKEEIDRIDHQVNALVAEDEELRAEVAEIINQANRTTTEELPFSPLAYIFFADLRQRTHQLEAERRRLDLMAENIATRQRYIAALENLLRFHNQVTEMREGLQRHMADQEAGIRRAGKIAEMEQNKKNLDLTIPDLDFLEETRRTADGRTRTGYTVAQLKTIARNLGLPTGGNKLELVERILTHLRL
jgi:hypothetical protein